MEKIGFTNLKAQYQECKREINAVVQHVFDTNNFITGNTNFDITSGSYRDILEYELMKYTGAKNCGACGSGTTAIAAAKNNRQYIGCELNSEYVALANERIKSEIGLLQWQI